MGDKAWVTSSQAWIVILTKLSDSAGASVGRPPLYWGIFYSRRVKTSNFADYIHVFLGQHYKKDFFEFELCFFFEVRIIILKFPSSSPSRYYPGPSLPSFWESATLIPSVEVFLFWQGWMLNSNSCIWACQPSAARCLGLRCQESLNGTNLENYGEIKAFLCKFLEILVVLILVVLYGFGFFCYSFLFLGRQGVILRVLHPTE